MGPVRVNEDPGGVQLVISVATDVVTAVEDKAPGSPLAGEALGEHATGKSGSDDEVVPNHLVGRRCREGEDGWREKSASGLQK